MKIGIQELLLVFIIALVVVGPDKLPLYARKLGQAFGEFRKYTEEATKDIRESVVEPLEEAQRPLREAMEPVTELEKNVRNNVNDLKKSIHNIGKPGGAAGREAPVSPTDADASADCADESRAPASMVSEPDDQIPASGAGAGSDDENSAQPEQAPDTETV